MANSVDMSAGDMGAGDMGTGLTPAAITAASTEALKQWILGRVEGRDGQKMGAKVRQVDQELRPVFEALGDRNPTPDLNDQISLVQGVWRSVWSTIPFQDILPGRSHEQSYQIFADNGYYANLARYELSDRIPLIGRLARGWVNYDLMIVQSYGISEEPDADQAWDIENVSIRQKFRLKTRKLTPDAAQSWFNRAIAKHLAKQATGNADPQSAIPTAGINRSTAKRYEKVYQSKPKLEHLYIDRDFRLVKSRREKNQRPSYTIATRLI